MIVRKTLSNGLRLIYEKIPYVNSVSIGVWAGVGSSNESESLSGISHFTEHMLFKGTKRRSAKDIAEEMDFAGGHINAFTSKEATCYYAKVIESDIEKAVDILSDMYLNSLISSEDTFLERKVIAEEIGMYEDSPEDVVLDTLSSVAWGDSPLGFSVSGSLSSIENIAEKEIRDFIDKYYTAENTVISVTGNFDEDKLYDIVNKYFGDMRRGAKISGYEKASFHCGRRETEKDIEQTHIAIGFEAEDSQSSEIYNEAVLCNILGGTMSSRLFQKIREEKGLCYSVYSAPESFHNNGMFYIYAGLSPENLEGVKEIIFREIDLLLRNGISDFELQKGKSQLRGSYILSIESISGRMNSMGKSEVLGEEIKTYEEVMMGIDSVTGDSVNSLINKIFGKGYAESVVKNK